MTKTEYILFLNQVINRRRINFSAFLILTFAANHEGRNLTMMEIQDGALVSGSCAYGHVNPALAGCFTVNSAEKTLTYRINRKGSDLLHAINEEVQKPAIPKTIRAAGLRGLPT